MAIDFEILCRELKPSNTSILFGSGSSIPSLAPSTKEFIEAICKMVPIDYDSTLTLADVGTLAEMANKRKEMVNIFRNKLKGLQPATGLLNLPLYDWKEIYTTNYDELIEDTYRLARRDLAAIASNFDFSEERSNTSLLFKIHGTLAHDRSFGHKSSMVISNGDYELAQEYRELIFSRFLSEVSRNDFLVIGHSLSDPDLNAMLAEIIRRKKSSGAPGQLYALIYTRDDNRAALLTQKGFKVCFGGIDEFFSALAQYKEVPVVDVSTTGSLVDGFPRLRPNTLNISQCLAADRANPIRLFNGGSPTYGDIQSELTFTRDLSSAIETQLADEGRPVAYVLGPAGFGKSTLARQVAASLSKRGFLCWEHRSDFSLISDDWIKLAKQCAALKQNYLLVVDDAHTFMRPIDSIVDSIHATKNKYFRLLLTSSPAKWHPRSKTPNIYRVGVEHTLTRLSTNEINSLLNLFERKTEISSLVELKFSGFNRQERYRRLSERCKSDMFVCMKNIFGFAQLDDIILREYGDLDENLKDIYRTVAAMEACQIRVHRQLVLRVLGLQADYVPNIVKALEGTVEEHVVSDKHGIYTWSGRHQVISDIILRYKYNDQDALFTLFDRVTDFVNPTYEIERHNINEMCDVKLGIGRVRDRDRQNYLFRKLISLAPAQRVPRHRLIYNLIQNNELEPALAEIRLFEKELRQDAPLIRYKALLQVERAKTAEGIEDSDRLVILQDADDIVNHGLEKYNHDKSLHRTKLDIGIEVLRLSHDWSSFDEALTRLRSAAEDYLDPEMNRLAARYQSRADSIARGLHVANTEPLEDENT